VGRGDVALAINQLAKFFSRDDLWKLQAKTGSRNLMIGTNKKRHRTVEIADPGLGRASVEIERAFFGDLALSIRRGKDLDRNSHGRKIHQKMAKDMDSKRRIKSLMFSWFSCCYNLWVRSADLPGASSSIE
jgi:hypothetical protein